MKSRNLILIALLVGLPLLGALIGFALRALPSERGVSLGATPEPAQKIVAAAPAYVIVETTSGNYFQCTFVPREIAATTNCWKPTTTNTSVFANSVDSPRIEQARFASPPGSVRDYWIASHFDSIGGFIYETRYALLDDGRVWAWTYETNTLINVSKIFDGVIGAVFGLCCAGVLALILWAVLAATVWPKQPATLPSQ